jgi:sugar lactone lactonase YvrE
MKMSLRTPLLLAALALPLAACNMGSQSGGSATATSTAQGGGDVQITSQPQNTSVSAGQSAQFSVGAIDTKGRTLMYQWLRNNSVISGATGSSYSFTAQSSDVGANFSVVVTDQEGCLQSLYNGHMDNDQKRCVLSGSAALALGSGGGIVSVTGSIGGAGNLNGQGGASRFNGPTSVAQDSHGNYYVADGYNQLIRKITPAGLVSTYAGKYGMQGHTDGNVADATFNLPAGIVADSADNLYVADAFNGAIRKITPAGVVSTLAGGAAFGSGTCTDGTGSAARFNLPQGIAVDAAGNVYVADSFCGTIRKVTPAGVVTTLSSTWNGELLGVAVSPDGSTVYYDNGNQIFRLDPVSHVTTVLAGSGTNGAADGTGEAASFNGSAGMALDSSGTLYVADNWNCAVRKVTASGVVTTLAGPSGGCLSAVETDGTGTAANFLFPNGVLADNTGNLVVSDVYGETIRKVSLGGITTTFAGLGANIGATDGTGAVASFGFLIGSAITADSSGNLYIAEVLNNLIRKVTPAGVVTTVAGGPGQQGYVEGTGSAARFNMPSGIAVNASGTLYVADTSNSAIRQISPAGVVSTLAGGNGWGSADGVGSAAQFRLPTGVATDSSGNVYVADYYNNTIRKVTAAGVVTTLAGNPNMSGSADGTGSAALFSGPLQLVVDSTGTIYVSDSNNSTIRKISPAGVVTTLAGTAGVPGSADGTGSAARFNFSVLVTLGLTDRGGGLTLDAAGNLYLADTNNGTIRKITPTGVVSTVAGSAGQVGIQLGALPSTLGPTQGVVVVGNTLYTTVASASLLSFQLP